MRSVSINIQGNGYIIIFIFSVILILSKKPEVIMKTTDKGKQIRTAPKGAWESGIINEKKKAFQKTTIK